MIESYKISFSPYGLASCMERTKLSESKAED